MMGGAGDDQIYGGGGVDTAVFVNPRADYEILSADEQLLVRDSIPDRGGYDSLSGIERLRFADQEIDVSDGGRQFELERVASLETGERVTAPPPGAHSFYEKYINADGVTIVSSAGVPDEALIAARRTVLHLLRKRPDVHRAMLAQHPRISIMALDETASDLPEYGPGADGQWGLGQMPDAPTILVSIRGVCYPGNTDYRANFLLHEFVHNMQNLGWPTTDPSVEDEIYSAYTAASAASSTPRAPSLWASAPTIHSATMSTSRTASTPGSTSTSRYRAHGSTSSSATRGRRRVPARNCWSAIRCWRRSSAGLCRKTLAI